MDSSLHTWVVKNDFVDCGREGRDTEAHIFGDCVEGKRHDAEIGIDWHDES